MKAWAICTLLAALLVGARHAAAAQLCDGIYGDHPEALRLAEVVGQPPRLLMAIPSDCRPNEDGCRWPITLSPRTLIAAFQSAAGFVCVEATPESGRRRWGWLPESNLRANLDQRTVPSTWWVGHWSGLGYNKVSISLEGDALHGEGSAELGPHDNPRFADFAAVGVVSGESVVFRERECVVRATRFGPRIVVMDNAQCGPMARLSGFYERTEIRRR